MKLSEATKRAKEELQSRANRLGDWSHAQRKIRDILKLEVTSNSEMAQDHRLHMPNDTSLALGPPDHLQQLSFNLRPSGNVRVTYTSPYLVDEDGNLRAAVFGTEAPAAFASGHQELERYLTMFWEKVGDELADGSIARH